MPTTPIHSSEMCCDIVLKMGGGGSITSEELCIYSYSKSKDTGLSYHPICPHFPCLIRAVLVNGKALF